MRLQCRVQRSIVELAQPPSSEHHHVQTTNSIAMPAKALANDPLDAIAADRLSYMLVGDGKSEPGFFAAVVACENGQSLTR